MLLKLLIFELLEARYGEFLLFGHRRICAADQRNISLGMSAHSLIARQFVCTDRL